MNAKCSSETERPPLTSRFSGTSMASEVLEGVDLTGRMAIVTGGAAGIGRETVRALAAAGADVMIAARNTEAAASAAEEINAIIGAERVTFDRLELDELSSVSAFAERWGTRPLSLLINNAGVMACPQGQTRDGFETQFGTNHLGHFLLTILLRPALERGAPSRVVVLSSAAHRYSGIDFDDLHFERRAYHPFRAYGQSKTANALFALEFDRRFSDRGIRAFSVMPGVIKTDLGRHMTPQLRDEMGFAAAPAAQAPVIEYKSIEAGAATSVWAATAPELAGIGGAYLEDCAQAPAFSEDLPRGKGVMPFALDPEAALKLWDVSEKLVKLR